MMKKKFLAVSLAGLAAMSVGNVVAEAAVYDFEYEDVAQNKTWILDFESTIDESSAEKYISLHERGDDDDISLEIELENNDKRVLVKPKKSLDEKETYVLVVEKELTSKENEGVLNFNKKFDLEEDLKIEFETHKNEMKDEWFDDNYKVFDDDVEGDLYVTGRDVLLDDLEVEGDLYIDTNEDGQVRLMGVTADTLHIVSASKNGVIANNSYFRDVKVYDDAEDALVWRNAGRSDEWIVKVEDIDDGDIEVRDRNDEIWTLDYDGVDSVEDFIEDSVEDDDVIAIKVDDDGEEIEGVRMVIEEDRDSLKSYKILDRDKLSMVVGFGLDKDDDIDDYYDKDERIEKYTEKLYFGDSTALFDDLDRGDFARITLNTDGTVQAAITSYDDSDDLDDDDYAMNGLTGGTQGFGYLTGYIYDVDEDKNDYSIDIEDGAGYKYTIQIPKGSSMWEAIDDNEIEFKDIVRVKFVEDDGDYVAKDIDLLVGYKDFDESPLYKVVEEDDNSCVLGFGLDVEATEDEYGSKTSENYRYAANAVKIGNIYEGDFVQVSINSKNEIDAIKMIYTADENFNDNYYAEEAPTESEGEGLQDGGLVKVLDIDEYSKRVYAEVKSSNQDINYVRLSDDAEDMVDDNDIEIGALAEIDYDDDDNEITDFDVLIDGDDDNVYKVVDLKRKDLELGYGQDVDTDKDDFRESRISELDKSSDFDTFGSIDEGDFVRVKMDDDEVELLEKVEKPKELADKSPRGKDDNLDSGIFFVDDIELKGGDYIVTFTDEDEDDEEYTAHWKVDDDIKNGKLQEDMIVRIRYDDDDNEFYSYDVLAADNDDHVYKLIDMGSRSIELGFGMDTDTDEDEFTSSKKIELDKDRSAEEFWDIDEGDFVKVYIEDDEVIMVYKVSEPDELADKKPSESSDQTGDNDDKDDDKDDKDLDSGIFFVDEVDEDDGEYTVTFIDEDEDEIELEADSKIEDDLEDGDLEEDMIVRIKYDEDEEEFYSFKVLAEDDEDDVYKVLDIGSRDIELGFDMDPDTDEDDFKSSKRVELDKDRSAEEFWDIDEGDFVKVYIEDDEVIMIYKVGEPDELADDEPND